MKHGISDGEWFRVWIAVGGMGMAFGEFLKKVQALAARSPSPEQ